MREYRDGLLAREAPSDGSQITIRNMVRHIAIASATPNRTGAGFVTIQTKTFSTTPVCLFSRFPSPSIIPLRFEQSQIRSRQIPSSGWQDLSTNSSRCASTR